MTTLWFVAGEASGDARAAEVMNVLGAIAPENSLSWRGRSENASDRSGSV